MELTIALDIKSDLVQQGMSTAPAKLASARQAWLTAAGAISASSRLSLHVVSDLTVPWSSTPFGGDSTIEHLIWAATYETIGPEPSGSWRCWNNLLVEQTNRVRQTLIDAGVLIVHKWGLTLAPASVLV